MMIQTESLAEFVRSFIKTHNDDMEEKTLWDIWLHKCKDGTGFTEFRSRILHEDMDVPDDDDVKNVITESKNILDGFVPE